MALDEAENAVSDIGLTIFPAQGGTGTQNALRSIHPDRVEGDALDTSSQPCVQSRAPHAGVLPGQPGHALSTQNRTPSALR